MWLEMTSRSGDQLVMNMTEVLYLTARPDGGTTLTLNATTIDTDKGPTLKTVAVQDALGSLVSRLTAPAANPSEGTPVKRGWARA